MEIDEKEVTGMQGEQSSAAPTQLYSDYGPSQLPVTLSKPLKPVRTPL